MVERLAPFHRNTPRTVVRTHKFPSELTQSPHGFQLLFTLNSHIFNKRPDKGTFLHVLRRGWRLSNTRKVESVFFFSESKIATSLVPSQVCQHSHVEERKRGNGLDLWFSLHSLHLESFSPLSLANIIFYLRPHTNIAHENTSNIELHNARHDAEQRQQGAVGTRRRLDSWEPTSTSALRVIINWKSCEETNVALRPSCLSPETNLVHTECVAPETLSAISVLLMGASLRRMQRRFVSFFLSVFQLEKAINFMRVTVWSQCCTHQNRFMVVRVLSNNILPMILEWLDWDLGSLSQRVFFFSIRKCHQPATNLLPSTCSSRIRQPM